MMASTASPAPSDQRTKFLFVAGFMVVCLASLQIMPVLTPWGADL